MNFRSFFMMAVAIVGCGLSASYAITGCSPKTVIDDDGGTQTCMETSAVAGQGCPCDPMTYKAKACYEGPTGSLGPGRACKSGTRKCDPSGVLTACEGQVLPGMEVCNALDDDCNGRIDDLAGNEPVIADLSEAGLDPPIEAGVQCYVNGAQGLCAAGHYGCNSMGKKDCVALISVDPDGGTSPYTEVCNTLDDDCNGTVDDVDFTGQTCMVMYDDGGSPKGECANGKRDCVQGLDSCVGPKPAMETCNGKDDNCNGKYDENICPCGSACPVNSNSWCCVYQNTCYNFGSKIGNPYVCYQQ